MSADQNKDSKDSTDGMYNKWQDEVGEEEDSNDLSYVDMGSLEEDGSTQGIHSGIGYMDDAGMRA